MICGAQIELNFSQHGWDEYYEDYPTLSYTRTMNYVGNTRSWRIWHSARTAVCNSSSMPVRR